MWVHRSAALHAANTATRVILIMLVRGKDGRFAGDDYEVWQVI
jgi:hypothetical protein